MIAEQLLVKNKESFALNNIGIFSNDTSGRSTLLAFLLSKAVRLGIKVVGIDMVWERSPWLGRTPFIIDFVQNQLNETYWSIDKLGIPSVADLPSTSNAIVVGLPTEVFEEGKEQYISLMNKAYKALVEYAYLNQPCILFIDNCSCLFFEDNEFSQQFAKNWARSGNAQVGTILVLESAFSSKLIQDVKGCLDVKIFGQILAHHGKRFEKVLEYPENTLGSWKPPYKINSPSKWLVNIGQNSNSKFLVMELQCQKEQSKNISSDKKDFSRGRLIQPISNIEEMCEVCIVDLQVEYALKLMQEELIKKSY